MSPMAIMSPLEFEGLQFDLERTWSDKKAARDPSPTRVLQHGDRVESDLVDVRDSYFDSEWRSSIASTSSSLESWELPAARDDRFWIDPATTSEANIGRLQSQSGGRAPDMLSLVATFPKAGRNWRASSSQVHAFMMWDDWLQAHASDGEKRQLSGFFAQSSPSFSSESFPPALKRKYPGLLEKFLDGHAALFPKGRSNLSASWGSRYAASWRVYASAGLELQGAILQTVRGNLTPAMSEYLEYKALTSGLLQCVMLAAENMAIPYLEEDAFAVVAPVVLLASMLAGIVHDLFVLQSKRQSGVHSLCSWQVYDEDVSQALAAALFGQLHSASKLALQEVELLEDDQAKAAKLFLDVLKSSLHGLLEWHKLAKMFSPVATKSGEVSFFASKSGSSLDIGTYSWVGSQLEEALASASTKKLH